jgi:hypothetical protein
MNFLSHYYFDRHLTDDWFAIGVSTPDLLSIFNREVRLRESHITALSFTPNLSAEQRGFFRGVLRHFEGDKVFHSSPFFHDETHTLAALLRREFGPDVVARSFFVSHILLELTLDKVLIQTHPGLLEKYYHHFDTHSPHEIAALTEWVAGVRLPSYEGFIEKFIERKFLYQYTHWDHVVYVLKRILQRVNVLQYSYLDRPRFAALMDAYEAQLTERYSAEFSLLNTQLQVPVLV